MIVNNATVVNVLDFHAKKLDKGCKDSEIVQQKHVLSSVSLLVVFRVAFSKNS